MYKMHFLFDFFPSQFPFRIFALRPASGLLRENEAAYRGG